MTPGPCCGSEGCESHTSAEATEHSRLETTANPDFTAQPNQEVEGKNLMDDFLLVQNIEQLVVEDRPYKIAPIPGKDLGVIATSEIVRGQQIFRETPVMTESRFAEISSWTEQFDNLSEEDKTAVLSLHNVRECRGSLAGILWTNAIPLQNTKDETGLFIKASRINHSCLPSTNLSWDPTQNELRVYATRHIAQGEEITSSYIPNLAEYEDRQAHLESTLNFVCTCPLCTLPMDQRTESDQRIRDINQLLYELRTACPWTQQTLCLALIRKLLRLYEEESVVDWRPADVYYAARMVTGGMRGNPRVRVFLKRELDIRVAVEGPNGVKAKKLMKKLRSTHKFQKTDDLDEQNSADFEEWLFEENKLQSWDGGWIP